MSKQQDNLDEKLSDAKATAERLLQKKRKTSQVETVKNRTPKDYFLSLLALVSLISAGLTNSYLPAYWAPANDIWTRVGIITGLVVFSLICFFSTNYGTDFRTLVKEAGVELKRVTWPTKGETINWTWLSLVCMAVFGVVVAILDFVFNKMIGFIIG